MLRCSMPFCYSDEGGGLLAVAALEMYVKGIGRKTVGHEVPFIYCIANTKDLRRSADCSY